MIQPKTIVLILTFFLSFASISQCTYTAVANGSWNNPSTWSKSNCAANTSSTPTGNCKVIIPANRTVVFTTTNNSVYTSMFIYVLGELEFDQGRKMYLDCNSYLEISVGGEMEGDNHGSKIDYCGSWVWEGEEVEGFWSIGNNALPISLKSFDAQLQNDRSIQVEWTTASEENNAFFELYHSSDAQNWELIYLKTGAGNSNQNLTYSFNHLKTFSGSTQYYQLKQIDRDGKSTYSEIISVQTIQTKKIDVYPNPANDFIHIEFENQDETSLVQIFDFAGKEKLKEEVYNSNQPKTIATHQLENGAYLIYVNGIMQGKLMIAH